MTKLCQCKYMGDSGSWLSTVYITIHYIYFYILYNLHLLPLLLIMPLYYMFIFICKIYKKYKYYIVTIKYYFIIEQVLILSLTVLAVLLDSVGVPGDA